MKLPNDGGSWRHGIATVGERGKIYRLRIGVGWVGFFLDFQPELHQWYYMAEISSSEGGGLYRWQTNRERKHYFNKLFEKLKEK
jgi:hypothetical protein